jgi:hypothetical protein
MMGLLYRGKRAVGRYRDTKNNGMARSVVLAKPFEQFRFQVNSLLFIKHLEARIDRHTVQFSRK